ncbi:MAG: tRNA (N6-isopentenyl adenosine(37)-C2)-methylthiotransferase MiaB [Verrucomicrobiales bacterium]|nr:tRNA (N6-isopentenyl adenosine(37)-C2)-methylthiotransferase MiaB [Verrucomicrobiales bacterium]
MPSVFIKTYGCQMNERDSEAVAAQLLARGYALSPSEHEADVVLLNTCSVRDFAEQKALGKMQSLAGTARSQGRSPILGFMGCMAQSRGAGLLEEQPRAHLVLGTQKFHRAAEHLDALLSGRERQVVDVAEEARSQDTIREHLPAAGARAVTAFVSIMQGCNQHCTFCIVPFTRGEERSRTIPDVVEEVRTLVSRGVREVTLLGQIVTSFGRREIPVREGKSGFVQLLEAVQAVDGLERIRFTSPHPKGYGDDLIGAFGRLSKLTEHAHLPLQSGSDRILKQMHRGYTRDRYRGLVERLRAAHPDMGVTTDIIVGFPGETEDDFAQTLSFCEEIAFEQAYLFKYSPRRDTPAASLPDPVPQEVIEERHARLLALINRLASEKFANYVGRTVEILVEGPSRKNAARFEGRTRDNRIVIFPGSDRHLGELLPVRIERAGAFTLYGDPAIVGFSPADAAVESPSVPEPLPA